jgi:hypothetical protein
MNGEWLRPILSKVPEGRQNVAQRVSAGERIYRRASPDRGDTWISRSRNYPTIVNISRRFAACGPVLRVTPAGDLGAFSTSFPTASAVGYVLAPLRGSPKKIDPPRTRRSETKRKKQSGTQRVGGLAVPQLGGRRKWFDSPTVHGNGPRTAGSKGSVTEAAC